MSKKEGEKIAKLKCQLNSLCDEPFQKNVHEIYDLNTYNSLKKKYLKQEKV